MKTRAKTARALRATRDHVRVHGFFRVQIGMWAGRGAVIVGDTGWRRNTVTNDGLTNYIAGTVGAVSGSKQVSHMGIGTQTNAINATQSELSGPLTTESRVTVSPSTINTGTFQATASWGSAVHTAASTIGALGLYNTSAGGSMAAGQTFATSQWASNQNVSATYQLRFS